MKTKLKDLDKAVALEIEAKIVPALNEAYSESSADNQTWEDKVEAARGEFEKRYPDETQEQLIAWLDEFCQDYTARPMPFEIAAENRRRDAADDLLAALKDLVRLPLDTGNVAAALKAIELAEEK